MIPDALTPSELGSDGLSSCQNLYHKWFALKQEAGSGYFNAKFIPLILFIFTEIRHILMVITERNTNMLLLKSCKYTMHGDAALINLARGAVYLKRSVFREFVLMGTLLKRLWHLNPTCCVSF